MYKLELTRKSKNKLDLLKSADLNSFKTLINELSQIQINWTDLPNIKNIGNSIFRKRSWRWRILFTISYNIITVWIIEIEKDTKKDYQKWKDYIISNM